MKQYKAKFVTNKNARVAKMRENKRNHRFGQEILGAQVCPVGSCLLTRKDRGQPVLKERPGDHLGMGGALPRPSIMTVFLRENVAQKALSSGG